MIIQCRHGSVRCGGVFSKNLKFSDAHRNFRQLR
jgi:hypothetical protein